MTTMWGGGMMPGAGNRCGGGWNQPQPQMQPQQWPPQGGMTMGGVDPRYERHQQMWGQGGWGWGGAGGPMASWGRLPWQQQTPQTNVIPFNTGQIKPQSMPTPQSSGLMNFAQNMPIMRGLWG